MVALSDQTRKLSQQRARTAERHELLKVKEQAARNREIYALGGMVRKTRLPELDHAALYGALLTLAADVENPVVVAKWAKLGERKLTEDQAADDVGKTLAVITFHAFPGKQAAARMKEAGFRHNKLFGHRWEGKSDSATAEAIAKDHGGVVEYPQRSVAPEMREAAE